MHLTTDRITRAVRHVGRRGAFLLFLTLVDAVLAYSIQQPLPLGLDVRIFYKPMLAVMPLCWWSVVWLAVGALTAVAAVWKPAEDVAFPAAALMKTAWALCYIVGWLSDYPGFSRGYQTGGIFAAFALIVLLVSSWRENGT